MQELMRAGNVQLRLELARSTTLLGRAVELATVTTLTVTTVAAGTAVRVTAHQAAGRSMAALLLDVGGRDNLRREVEPLAEVGKTGLGEGVVVVLPRELGLDVAAGSEGLASLDDLFGESES